MNLVACEISLPPYSLSQGFSPGETFPAARSEKRGETVDFAGYESCDKCQRKNICFSSRVSFRSTCKGGKRVAVFDGLFSPSCR